MIKNIFKNFIKTFVSFNLIVLPAFGTTPDASERTIDKIDTFIKSSAPSDIPFIDYMERFIPDNSQPLKKFDLSAYDTKKIFVGYGVYDAGQNYCKYTEKPGTKDPSLYFDNILSFNKHTYAISKGTMSYDNCVALANDFGGLPAVITSASENTFIQGISSKDKWVGSERIDCNSSYVDKMGDKQVYFNWSTKTESQCSSDKLNIIQNKNGNWLKSNKNTSLNSCVVEVDSEDFKRPVKICAPWWKIERDYANPVTTTFNGVDIYKINQADIPEQFNVCVKYNENALKEAESKPDREVTCTSYYDTQVAPECLKNPKQAICFVDECNGYIKNACRKTDDYQGFKPYTKTESIINSNNKIIKGKVDIKTHIYECPPSPPSSKSCEEQATVIIYPKECPNNSDCEGRKQCIQKAVTTEEKSKCSVDFKCEKIYGNPDSTEFDSAGNLTYLKNVCSDGTELKFEINTQNKTSKKCLEYEYYDISTQVNQRCVLDRPSFEPIVDTSLTEEDIYMNDPNCVRLNNVTESRPQVEVKINYENMGYAKTVIKKSYLDESQTNLPILEGSDKLITDSALNNLDPFKDQNTTNIKEITQPTTVYNCDKFTENWNQRNDVLNQKISYQKTGSNGVVTTETRLTSGLYNDASGMYFPYTNVVAEADCLAIKNQIANATSYTFDSLSNYCKVYTPTLTGDVFSNIKGNGTLNSYVDDEDGSTYFEYSTYSYITKEAVNKATCNEMAYCLNGKFNEKDYEQVGLNQCQITEGEGIDYTETELVEDLVIKPSENFDTSCKPISKSGSYISQFNGTQDIFSIQEVVSGNFGYYSNYNSHPYKNNVVKINDVEAYPIKKMSVIDDSLIYTGDFEQTSITTKKPNYLVGFLTGGVISVALSEITGMVIGNITFMIASIIFAKKQKLNEQYYEWTLYKLVPVERYEKNIYGYDNRILKLNSSNTMDITNGKVTLIYAKLSGFTGTLKPGDFVKTLKKLISIKEGIITCLGFDLSQVQTLHDSFELGVEVDYPKCKKLSWNCDKRNTDDDTFVKNPFMKKMVNNYIGAVNGISIVVPYLGEYEVKAYDQFDNLLGSMIVKEDEFIDMTNNVAKYAQLNFGLTMELADGINEGRKQYACRNDLMVEWGGGVSGIYYENNFTGSNSNCQKSHDSYVRTSSATKITVRSTGTDRPHIIQLEKPLPFANRAFLVTLNKKEKRQYRCFKDFGDCNTESYK